MSRLPFSIIVIFIFFQNEARKMNHQEVVEEDRRKKLPTNWEARKSRAEWEEEQERLKKVKHWQGLVWNLLLCTFKCN